MVITQAEHDKHKAKKIKFDYEDRNKIQESTGDIVDFVPSSSYQGSYYIISKKDETLICSCPGFKHRGKCKHIKNGK